MYNIVFYKDAKGEQPALNFLQELANGNDKNSRISLCKLRDYIKILSMFGLNAGMPYIKHVRGAIWELRPQKNRIFFVAFDEGKFVLLHGFRKTTRKTPNREIAKATIEYEDLIKRGNENA